MDNTFEHRTGPAELAAQVTYPDMEPAQWFKDAKLGFFIHLGLYSVPAWAYRPTPGEQIPSNQAFAKHQYAEWYANTVRITNSPCRQWHDSRFGIGTTYEDFAEVFAPLEDNLHLLIRTLVHVGGQYIVPTTKHHDGFCLWNTSTTPFNVVRRSPNHTDVISCIASETRSLGAKLGLYYSGALDWHASEFPPILSNDELFIKRRNDQVFARYCAAQLTELIDQFRPNLLWNDIDWPDSGKGPHDYGLSALLSHFKQIVPDATINDRWGVPCYGYLTREYIEIDKIQKTPWEATRGLNHSFGLNTNDNPADRLSACDLAWLLIDTASKNGNLLINVGPSATGQLDTYQAGVLKDFGAWMSTFGQWIYQTQPWDTFSLSNDTSRVLVGQTFDVVFFHPDTLKNTEYVTIPTGLRSTHIEWIANDQHTEADCNSANQVTIPPITSAMPFALLIHR